MIEDSVQMDPSMEIEVEIETDDIKCYDDDNKCTNYLDIDRKNLSIIRKPEKKKRRNKGGCLCCRKRKIKCDEIKPVCSKCFRSSYVCVWPKTGNESLSHNNDFKLTKNGLQFIDVKPKYKYSKIDKNTNSNRNRNKNDKERNNNKLIMVNDKKALIKFKQNIPINEKADKLIVNKFNTNNNEDEDAIIRKYIRETSFKYIPSTHNNMNSEQMRFFDAFINGFIVSITNQITHEKLLPGMALIPFSLTNSIIKKMCLTCGASFLYRCNEGGELIDKINNENNLIINEILWNLDNKNIIENRELLLIYFVLRNSRQRFFYEGRTSQTINLISGIQTIKLWIKTKYLKDNKILEISSNEDPSDFINTVNLNDSNSSTSMSNLCIKENNTSDDEINSYILLDKLVDKLNTVDIITELNSDNDSSTNRNSYNYKNNEVTAFERTILETFIFNYSSTLFIIDKTLLKCIPSPFEVFNLIQPLLYKPIFNCAVSWMNHPTVGPAISLIELQAKIIWLSFNKEFEIDKIKKIQKIVKYYTRPIIPIEIIIKYPQKISKKMIESCIVSEIISKGVYLFSIKILDFNVSEFNEEVEKCVESVLNNLKDISQHSQTSVIAKWSFIVIGCAIMDITKREFFKKRLLGFIDALKTGSLRTVLTFLEKVWESNIGLDALFIEEYLNLLVI